MRLEGMAEILGKTDRKSSENVLQIQQSLSCTKFWQKNCHYIGNTVKAVRETMNILLQKQTIQGRKISTAINYSTNYTTAKTRLIHYTKGQQNLTS